MKAWMVRSKPEVDKMDVFLNRSICGVGWSRTGDLTGMTRDELRNILRDSYNYVSNRSLGFAISTVDRMVNQLNIGDIVLVPDSDNIIHFGEIESDYIYEPELGVVPHIRKVKWLNHIERGRLSEDLRKPMNRNIIVQLTKHLPEIMQLACS